MCLSSAWAIGHEERWKEWYSLSAGEIPFMRLKLTDVEIVNIVGLVGLGAPRIASLSTDIK